MCMSRWVGERIVERLPDLVLNRFLAKDRQRRGQLEAKNAQVINSHDVIGMRMSHHRRTNQRRSFTDQLQAKLRTGIDDKFPFGCADQNSGTHSSVARIVGQADGAATSDHGHTDAGAGAHDDHFGWGLRGAHREFGQDTNRGCHRLCQCPGNTRCGRIGLAEPVTHNQKSGLLLVPRLEPGNEIPRRRSVLQQWRMNLTEFFGGDFDDFAVVSHQSVDFTFDVSGLSVDAG